MKIFKLVDSSLNIIEYYTHQIYSTYKLDVRELSMEEEEYWEGLLKVLNRVCSSLNNNCLDILDHHVKHIKYSQYVDALYILDYIRFYKDKMKYRPERVSNTYDHLINIHLLKPTDNQYLLNSYIRTINETRENRFNHIKNYLNKLIYQSEPHKLMLINNEIELLKTQSDYYYYINNLHDVIVNKLNNILDFYDIKDINRKMINSILRNGYYEFNNENINDFNMLTNKKINDKEI